MRRLLLIASVLMLGVVGGCAERPGAGSDMRPGLPEGRTFLSTDISDGGKPRPLVDGTRIRLSFDGGELRADAGCNSLLGQARLANERLVVDGLGGTEMGCSPELMAQDQWLSGFLGGRPRLQLADDELTLTAGDVRIVLVDREVADPDRPLRGTRWELDTIIDGDTASSVPAGVRANLQLGRNNASGNNGCNSFSGKLTVSGSSLRMRDVVRTLKGCSGDAAEVERVVHDVLTSNGLTYRIEADRLTLSGPSGKGLGFRAQ